MDVRGKTIWALAEAAISYSDNVAANLLLETIGGPAGFTAWLRTIGDHVTRLDRIEPDLNSAVPGDPRDTTTPSAMVADLRTLLLGPRLVTPLRDRLTGWLVVNTTGGARLRAALPSGWHIGDKTGTGGNGSTNDVAIVWPPGRAPVLVAAYLTETDATSDECNAALAEVGRVMVEWVGRT
jgi:beta-lactamase class A